MTREAQIRAVLKLLKPANTAECREFVSLAITDIERAKRDQQHEEDLASKSAKKALKAYLAALNRARVAHKSLPEGLKHTLEIAAKTSGREPLNLMGTIEIADGILALHRRRVVDFPRIQAAAWAKNILDLLGMQSPLKKKGTWPTLAGVLHGSPADDFYHHCSLYRAGPK
jgi:hypothetical protein